MEASRSFSMLFPISQSQIALPRSQHALGKQEQMRKKEVQLQNQLECICQRQRDAHRRNQDLLRDFKRIEQELSLLTAKSDSFRRKQEKYKKQMYPLISENSKCATPNSTTGHIYMKQFNDIPAANYGNLYEPCHFSASVGHIGQTPTHFSLPPNQQLGLQGCCNHSMCCGLVHPHHDEQYGSFIPDVCKMLDSTLDCQSQQKLCPTSDSSIPRNIMFIPNTKRGIIQHRPGFVCDKDSSLKCRTMTTNFHGDPLQCKLSSDMYRDWKEKLSKEVQQQMVGEPAVKTTGEQSTDEDSSRVQACYAGSVMAFSEYPQKPLDALSKSHLSSVSPPARDHNTKGCSKPASKRKKTKQLKTVYKSTPYEVTAEQIKEYSLCKEQATSNAVGNEMKLSLNMSNAPDSLVGIGENEQTSNYKTVANIDIGKVFCEQEIEILDSSEAENVHKEAIGHPDPQYLCPAGYLHQRKKDKGIHLLDNLLKSSFEECLDSSEEKNVLPKGSKIVYIIQKNEDEHSQKEEEKGNIDSRNSAKQKRLEREEQGMFREMVHHSQSLCAGNSFVINEDKMKANMYMSEQDSESSEKSESQMQEIKRDDGYIGMLKGDNKLASPSVSENKNTWDIYSVMGKSEIFRQMLTEEIEKCSSEEDRTSEGKFEAESSVHEKVCIFTVKEKDTHRKVNVNEESKTEDTGEDRTSGEDEISVNDSQGSPRVVMDAVIHGIIIEEQSNTEADKEKFTKKMEHQTECNTGNNIISKEEMSVKSEISDEERLSSEDLDVSDEIDSSVEEENTDFWSSRHEENSSGIEEMEKDVQLQSSSTEDSSKGVIADICAREDDPQEPATLVLDVPTASCQDLIEDEVVNSEKQRSSWLCCLKTCSLPHILKKREHQPQGKRCSEDGSMDIFPMHPVEFGSSLTAEETSVGSIANVHTEAESVAETNDEDSDEEPLHSEKESEDQNQPWSDMEDNVHSFYD